MIDLFRSPCQLARRLLTVATALGLVQGFGGRADAQTSAALMFTVNGQTFSSNGITEFPAGNALALNGQTAVANTPIGATSTPFTVLFQSQVNFNDATTNQPIVPSPGYFTIAGSFQETATRTAADAINLNLANPASSSFSIYFNPTGTGPNSFAGTGFNTGNLVYSGTVVNSFGNFSQSGQSGAFDKRNPGLVGNKQAAIGTGQTQFTVNETSYDSTFFKTNLTGTSFDFSISTGTQFITAGVDPSQNFFGTAPVLPTVNGALTTAEAVAAAAGIRYDIQFQTNGSGSFAIPEPASVAMTLLGLGGFGVRAFVTRRRKLAV